MEARHYTVSGFVQGVGFRWFVRKNAGVLKLKGWVRNLPNGNVEVWAEGDGASLDAFTGILREGPSSARVRNLEMEVLPASGAFFGFEVTY